MSQHTCKIQYKEKPAEVMIGWDKPLQRYFLVVEYEDPTTNMSDEEVDKYFESISQSMDDGIDPNIIYSNLCDKEVNSVYDGVAPLEYYYKKLTELEIIVPNSMFVECSLDKSVNRGNHDVEHTF